MSNSSILSPLQIEFLEQFFSSAVGKKFFLTGGTALAAYYLEHRYSEDIDLFTVDDAALEQAQHEITAIGQRLLAPSKVAVAAPSFRKVYLNHPQETLRVDLVRDIDVQFGTHPLFGNVIVDALENIGANKVTAIFGRTVSKDFVDLYFLLQGGLEFEKLLAMAKEKDGGLTEFYLAGMMRQVRNLERLPRMIKPLDLQALKQFYLDLEENMMRSIKPE